MKTSLSRSHKPLPLLRGRFHTSPCSASCYSLALYEEHLLVTDPRGVEQEYTLEFDLTFEVVQDGEEPDLLSSLETRSPIVRRPRASSPRRPVALKLFLRDHEMLALYQQQEVAEQWQSELLKRLNQRNFKGSFQALKKLGKGNYASVYLCRRIRDGKLFAVKAFSKEQNYSQDSGKAAIVNEAKVSRLFTQSQHVAKFQGVYESENSLYFVMEYIEGVPLQSLLDSGHKFHESQIRTILRGLLTAAAELARQDVVHRDIKPENIMLRKDTNQPVLVDFGLATLTTEPSYLFVRCGTPGYVAPEILKMRDAGSRCSSISDVFSIGCVFYCLCSRQNVFEGDTFQDVLENNRNCRMALDPAALSPEGTSRLIQLSTYSAECSSPMRGCDSQPGLPWSTPTSRGRPSCRLSPAA